VNAESIAGAALSRPGAEGKFDAEKARGLFEELGVNTEKIDQRVRSKATDLNQANVRPNDTCMALPGLQPGGRFAALASLQARARLKSAAGA